MVISREIKIGSVALLTIILFIWMYSFLKGANLLTRTAHYYVVYNEIGGLSESNPIEVSGYKVGVVQSIRFIDDGTGRLLVTLSLDKKMMIPKGSVAEITTATLIAGMKIQFIFSTETGVHTSGDTIAGRLAVPIMTRLENELIPLKDAVEITVLRLDSMVQSLNSTLTPSMSEDLQQTTANINSITGTLAESLRENQNEIEATIKNLNRFSGMLADNTARFDSTITSITAITDSIAAADIAGTIDRLRDAAAQTASLLESINDGKGSAGKLMTDDSVYINLNNSLANLSYLLEDLQKNPKRYVHFSVFGKKGEK